MLTLPGIARKSLVLLALVIASAAYTWRTAALQRPDAIMGAAAIGDAAYAAAVVVRLTRVLK